jgi:dTDP-4-amino-4,6-dideoxygalactose transaminase
MIPLIDLSYQHRQIDIDRILKDTLDSGRFIGGEAVSDFEHELAAYTGKRFCVSCGNGTDALVLILMAMGIGEGDEVITTPYSFFATVESILRVGATPVFADIDETYNIDPVKVVEAITPATAAIMPVHLFGRPVDDAIHQLGIPVIEDACQAIGARVGKGVAQAYSFFPSKNLGCLGDGGAITTDSEHIATLARIYANHGSVRKYHHTKVGMNSRLDAFQARILSAKLKHLDEWNQMRTEAAHYYDDRLGREHFDSVHHLYIVERETPWGCYYPVALHKQEAIPSEASCPIAESKQGITHALPLYPGITRAQMDEVLRGTM